MKELILFILILFCLNVYSQERVSVQAIKPDEKTRQELMQKINGFTKAWGKSDTATLGKLLAAEYRHSDIWGNILHRQDWLVYAATPRKVSGIISNDVEMLLYNDNMAVITGKMSYQFGEEKLTQEIRFSQVWSKNEGEWKRATFQATLIDKSK